MKPSRHDRRYFKCSEFNPLSLVIFLIDDWRFKYTLDYINTSRGFFLRLKRSKPLISNSVSFVNISEGGVRWYFWTCFFVDLYATASIQKSKIGEFLTDTYRCHGRNLWLILVLPGALESNESKKWGISWQIGFGCYLSKISSL